MLEVLDNLFGQKDAKKNDDVKSGSANIDIERVSKTENSEIDDLVTVRVDDIELNVSKDIENEFKTSNEVHPQDVEVEIFISRLKEILDREQSLDFGVVSLKTNINKLIDEYING